MTSTLENAIAQLADLPKNDQDEIGHQLLAHIARLRSLRADLAAGLRSLDGGRGKKLDIDDVMRRARERRAKTT